MKNKVVLSVLLSMLFCFGCGGPTFRSEVLNQAKNRGWTEKQSKAAAAYAYNFFLDVPAGSVDKESGDPLSDTDTKAVLPLPSIRYDMLGMDKIVARIDQWLEDLKTLLEYQLPVETKFVEAFGLRPSLLRDEKVLKAVRARVNAALLNRVFKGMLGQMPVGMPEMNSAYGYNDSLIFASRDPLEFFKFNFDQIEQAEKLGILKPIEHSRISIDRTFDRKERDPNNPDDRNAFVWIAKNQELELSNFKILLSDKPEDNTGNYIEGYRYQNGQRESRPCLKIFIVKNGSANSIFVIDTKKDGEPGFGLPDFIEERNVAVGVTDLIHDQILLARLFNDDDKSKRIPPKQVSIYAEIAKTESPIDVWEHTKDSKGFAVPFKYANPTGSNYNIRIEMDKLDTGTDTALAMTNPERPIKFFKKEWTTGRATEPTQGQVIELYKPKAPYDGMKFIYAKVLAEEDTKKIQLARPDGSVEDGLVSPGQNRFIEDKPVAIFYTEGDKRYVIKRSPGSLIFDRRKELSTAVTEHTGVYDEVY